MFRKMHHHFRHHLLFVVLSTLLLAITLTNQLCDSSDLHTITTEMLIRIVIVIGLSIFIGNSGVISFGHIAFAGIGAYAAAWADAEPSFKQIMLVGLPSFLQNNQSGLLLSILFSVTLAAIVAAALGSAIMRLSGIASSIATFAFLVMVNSIISNWDSVTAGVSSIVGIPTTVNYWAAFYFALLSLAVAYLFSISRFGLMLRATRDDEIAAQACGIDVFKVRLISFVLSAAVVGLGGGLYVHFLGILSSDMFYLNLAFITLAMLVVGGIRVLGGAVIGVIVVTTITQILNLAERGITVGSTSFAIPHGSQEIGLGILMAAILVFAPRGFFPALVRVVSNLGTERNFKRRRVLSRTGLDQ